MGDYNRSLSLETILQIQEGFRYSSELGSDSGIVQN